MGHPTLYMNYEWLPRHLNLPNHKNIVILVDYSDEHISNAGQKPAEGQKKFPIRQKKFP